MSKNELFRDILKAVREVKLVVAGNLFQVDTTREAKLNLRVSHLHNGGISLYGCPLVSIGQSFNVKRSPGLRIVLPNIIL